MQNEIIIYQSENLSTHIEVLIEDETVWLTQLQMVDLFQSTKQNISLHISNIFKEDELKENSVVKYSLITASDDKKYKTKLYNLDVIISVGYRVKSQRGTQFRIWANGVLITENRPSSIVYRKSFIKLRTPIIVHRPSTNVNL